MFLFFFSYCDFKTLKPTHGDYGIILAKTENNTKAHLYHNDTNYRHSITVMNKIINSIYTL